MSFSIKIKLRFHSTKIRTAKNKLTPTRFPFGSPGGALSDSKVEPTQNLPSWQLMSGLLPHPGNKHRQRAFALVKIFILLLSFYLQLLAIIISIVLKKTFFGPGSKSLGPNFFFIFFVIIFIAPLVLIG
jgi:hypothetical protein